MWAFVSICKYFTRFGDAATQIPVKQCPGPLSRKILIISRLADYGESVKITDHVVGSVGRCGAKTLQVRIFHQRVTRRICQRHSWPFPTRTKPLG